MFTIGGMVSSSKQRKSKPKLVQNISKWMKITFYLIVRKTILIWKKCSQRACQKYSNNKVIHHVEKLNIKIIFFVVYVCNTRFLFSFCILLLSNVCFFMANWNWLDFRNYLSFVLHSNRFSKELLKRTLFLLFLWLKNVFLSNDKIVID